MANDKDKQLVFDFILDDKSVGKAFDDVEKQGGKTADSLSKKFQKAFEDFGAKSLTEQVLLLNQGLELTSKAVAAVGKVFQTIAQGADLIKQQESVQVINQQFEILATRALGAGNDLRSGLVEAGKGLVDTEDLLQASSEAVLALGQNASRLPELFEVARKASFLFGGSALDNFNQLNQAITTGIGRGLIKTIGIDAEKVFKQFADNLRIPVESLTLAQRQAALLNAAITQTGATLGDIEPNTKKFSKALLELGVAAKDTGEGFDAAFSFFFKGIFTQATVTATNALKDFSNVLLSTFGEGAQKTDAQLASLQSRVETLSRSLAQAKLNQEFNIGDPTLVESLTKSLGEAQKALADFQTQQAASRPKGAAPPDTINIPDPSVVAERNAKFQQALLAAQQSNFQLQVQAAQQIRDEDLRKAELDRLALGQKEIEEQTHLNKLAELKRQFLVERTLTESQYDQLQAAEKTRNLLAIEQIELASDNRRLERARQVAATIKSVIVSGLSSTLQSVGQALQKGENLFDAFGKGIVGIIGDLAIKLGEGLLAQGIALEGFISAINSLLPGSGTAAAALGAGLIIFGSALKASVGAGGGGGGGGFSPGGVAATPGDASTFVADEDLQAAAPGTSINLNVNGNIIPRDRGFARELNELIVESGLAEGTVSFAQVNA